MDKNNNGLHHSYVLTTDMQADSVVAYEGRAFASNVGGKRLETWSGQIKY